MQEISADDLIEELYSEVERFLPQDYRPLAKSFLAMMMNASWPDAVDLLAGIVKEYGRCGADMGYRQTRAVLDGLVEKVNAYERTQQPVPDS